MTTQFITEGTDIGKLVEVKQFYIQNGENIEHPKYSALGNNICDNNGCGPGPDFQNDPTKPSTVTTQFITNMALLETTSATRMVVEWAQISRLIPPGQVR